MRDDPGRGDGVIVELRLRGRLVIGEPYFGARVPLTLDRRLATQAPAILCSCEADVAVRVEKSSAGKPRERARGAAARAR
jgi:hypothetical protein